MVKRLLKTSKNWRLVISALLWYGLTAGNFTANAQTPYALWCSGEGDADTTPTMYFTCSSDSIYVGDTFNGQTVTAKWRDENVTDTPQEGEPSWMGGHPLSYWGPMKRVVFDESFKNVRPHSTAYWFCHWNKLTEIIGLENLNTSEVTSMQGMFIETGLTSLDLSTFDTSNVTNMSIMFGQNSTLTSINLSSFDTSKVENMGMMFYDCSGLTFLDLSHFNTSSVTNVMMMFASCEALEVAHLDEFEINVIDENSMGMFSGCTALQKIYCNHKWTITGQNANQSYIFYGCTNLTGENGTTYDDVNVNASYARPDLNGHPGYFTSNAVAQAIWTEGNYTLTFTYGQPYNVGDNFNGQTVTAIWTDTDVTASPTTSDPAWSGINAQCTKVVFEKRFWNVYPTSCHSWFSGSAMTKVEGIENLNTDQATDMSNMFFGCENLSTLDVTKFDTGKVTTMNAMFGMCRALGSLDVNSFDMTSVVDKRSMFDNCSSLQRIHCNNTWTTDASDMMFNNCLSLEGGNGTVFSAEHINGEYAHPDEGESNPGYFFKSSVAQVVWTADNTTLTFLTRPETALIAVGDTFNGQTVTAVWSGTDVTESPTSGDGPKWIDSSIFDAATTTVFEDSFKDVRPKSCFHWFYSFTKMTQIVGIENLNTSEVTNMEYMFGGCQLLESLNVSHFDTSNVTSMAGMFMATNKLGSLDVTHFDTSNVTTMDYMFAMCETLTSIDVSNFDTSNVTNMEGMFGAMRNIEGLDVSNFDTSNVMFMAYMFAYCTKLQTLDLSNFDTGNVENMAYMFAENNAMTSVDVSSFDTRKVENMEYMFAGCRQLESLDVNNFDTSNVTNMEGLFAECSALTTLDVSYFDVSNVTKMNSIFLNCTNLTTIYCGNDWNTGNVTEYSSMFEGCTNLVGGDGTVYDEAHQEIDYAHPDEAGNPGYFTFGSEVIKGRLAGDGYYWTTYFYSPNNTYVANAEGQATTMYIAIVNEDQKSLELIEIEDAVAAKGQGVILKSNQQDITLKHSNSVATGDFTENALSGRDLKCDVPTDEGTIYTLGNKNNVLGFYKYTGSTLAARRAYLALPESSEAGFRFDFNGGTATAIDEVQDTRTQKNDVIYNLAGQRVSESALTPGIYIVNGKKIVKK